MSTFDSTTLEARQIPVVGNEQAHVVQFYTFSSIPRTHSCWMGFANFCGVLLKMAKR